MDKKNSQMSSNNLSGKFCLCEINLNSLWKMGAYNVTQYWFAAIASDATYQFIDTC